MKTVEEITGLERPIFEDYKDQRGEDDGYEAYKDNLEGYAYNLERFIEKEENKKLGDLKILYDDLKDLKRLNDKAIDLYCDIYLMLEETLDANYYKMHKNIYNVLHDQWFDVLRQQERIIKRIINGLQNYLNKKRVGRDEN